MQVLLDQVLPAFREGVGVQLAVVLHLLHQGHEAVAQHHLAAFQLAQLVGDGLQVGLDPSEGLFEPGNALQQVFFQVLAAVGILGFVLPGLVSGENEQAGAALQTGLPFPGIPGEAVLAIGTRQIVGHGHSLGVMVVAEA